MAKKQKKQKKQKKKLNVEDYTQPYIGTKETDQRIREFLDKEGKGAAGKTIVEMRKRHALVETSPGKYEVYEVNPSEPFPSSIRRKKSGGMVSKKRKKSGLVSRGTKFKGIF